MDEFTTLRQVRQVAQFPLLTSLDGGELALLQRGGLGGPYGSISAADLVGWGLASGGTLRLSAGEAISWNGTLPTPVTLRAGPLGFSLSAPVSVSGNLDAVGLSVAGQPVATHNWVQSSFDYLLAHSVASWNGRTGAVTLSTDDILRAGGAPADNPVFSGRVVGPTHWNPALCDDTLVTSAWVQSALCAGLWTFAGSPYFYGSPTAATPPAGDYSKRIANTQWVTDEIYTLLDSPEVLGVIVSGVSTFNGRNGAVVLAAGDITNAGGALLSGAAFTGAVTLAADPTTALGAATKKYVDARSSFVNIVSFGGVGDGVTDCTAAFNAAVAALPNGGTVYFPPGTWLTALSSGFKIPSGIHVQGAGENATTLIGNGNNYAITIVSLLTGTGVEPGTITYPINAPTQYGSTVTTTSAADAGNFNPNDVIFISGGLHSTAYWFPGFITTVASVNAGTGVITLNESLPIGGADVTIVQKVLQYVTDVKISDLTINIPPGAVTGGMQAVIARNVSIERVASRTNATTRHSYLSLAGVRDAYIQNSTFVGGYLDCLGCDNVTVVNCTVQQGVIVFDGGTINSSVINSDITDPQVDGSANIAISIVSGSQFNRVIGNLIKGQFGNVAIGVGGGGGALTGTYGWNTVIGNIIYGTNTTSPTGISVGPSVNNTIVGNNVNNVNTGLRVGSNSTGQIVSGNQFTNVPIPVSIDSTSGTIPPINDTWNIVPAGTTSPNVAFGSLLQTANTSATSITGFTSGIQGQEATLWVNDANTTLVNGGNFVLQQITNFSPPSGTMMKFSYRNGVWREISRSNNSGSANVNFRGLQIGPGGGGLTISSIATQAAARKGTLAIDTNNLAYYDPGLTSGAPSAFGGTSGTILAGSSSATIAATGTFTLTLPATPLTGAWVHLVSTTAQIVQSASANIIPITGGAAGTAIFTASAPHWCILQFNGTNWVTFASA